MAVDRAIAVSRLSETAPAKINLWLHVLGRRADGYHELDSLVAFADFGDTLMLDRAGLRVIGPYAEGCGPTGENLIFAAEKHFTERTGFMSPVGYLLEKRIPVAAGLGGGSADAAAALRLLDRALGDSADRKAILHEAAAATGSDVPACLESRARRIFGRGEILGPPLALPRLHAVLVNPRLPCPTGPVFRALGLEPGKMVCNRAPARLVRADAVTLAEIEAAGNDLEPAAISLVGEIAVVLEKLRATEGCRLARMSGSGATCFGLFSAREAADAAARSLAAQYAEWWTMASSLS